MEAVRTTQKVQASTRGRQVRSCSGLGLDAPAQLAIAARLRRTWLRRESEAITKLPQKMREKQRWFLAVTMPHTEARGHKG